MSETTRLMEEDDNKPLRGMRVYDATQGVAGPHATMLLALNGADVIKVEPLEGDWCRVLGNAIGQESVNYLAYNRGKRSMACDVKTAAGMEIVRKLIATCDVFVESFRPGVIGRMGLGYDEVSKINPKIIYASVSGFGQTGPNSQRPTVDGLIQAYSGMMVMNRTDDGTPHRMGMIVIDVVTGLYAYQAITTAIIRKLRFDQGSYLDINMVQSAAAFQAAKIMEYAESGGRPQPLYVPAGMFRTADGYIVVSGMRSHHFAALCGVVNRPDLAADPRWQTQGDRTAHGTTINEELRKEFVKRTSQEWLSGLHAVGVFAERVRSYGEWLEDDHARGSNAYAWVDTGAFGCLPVPCVPGVLPAGDNPSAVGAAPPLIGEHTRAILGELGFEHAWVDAQIAAGAIAETQRQKGPS